MRNNDKFVQFDYIIVRIILTILLILGALKITWPTVLEVRQILLK
jgi:hypothetical protein